MNYFDKLTANQVLPVKFVHATFNSQNASYLFLINDLTLVGATGIEPVTR